MASAPPEKNIKEMFARIARRYDLVNDLSSLGICRLWRRRVARVAKLTPKTRVLDAATGTGALAEVMARQGAQVVAVDFCEAMVRRRNRPEPNGLSYAVGDVLRLPFCSYSFDVVTIAFGIRNVPRFDDGISELIRVLKPGGKLVILEFGNEKNVKGIRGLWLRFFHLYLTQVLPRLGGVITRDPGAYSYLGASSLSFPAGRDFIEQLESGRRLSRGNFARLSGGVAFLYELTKSFEDSGERSDGVGAENPRPESEVNGAR